MEEKLKHKKVKKMLTKMDYIPGLKDELKRYFKKGYYNILLYMHLGDDFFRVSLKENLENIYGKVHFIIKPSEEILMKLWKIDNYSIFDIDSYIKNIFRDVDCKTDFLLDYYKCACIENTLPCEPNKEEVFILFPRNGFYSRYVSKLGRPKTIINWLNASANILKKEKIKISKINYPEPSKKLISLLQNHKLSLEKIVLFAPEARSDDLINKKIWNKLAENIKKQGYIIIENIINKKNHISGAIDLNLNTEELIMLAMHCHSVFSIRSGLCDLIIGRKNNLYVLFSQERYNQIESRFGFKNVFEFSENNFPHEIILSKKNKPILIWNNVNIMKGIYRSWLPSDFSFKNLIKKFFSITETSKRKIINLFGIKIKIKYNAEKHKIDKIQKNYFTIQKKLQKKIKNNNKINVIFLVYQNSKWKNQSLYEKLKLDKHFNVKILLTIADFQIFYTKKEREQILQKNYDFFKQRNMDVEFAWDIERNAPKELDSWAPDIIFYQAPYAYDPSQHIIKMSKKALCCYVPYYINQSENFTLMNTQFWHKCLFRWYVLDDYWKDISKKLINRDQFNRIKAVGHPQLDCYLSNLVKQKKYVIYAAHWSVGLDDGLSSFLDTGPFMLEYAKKHPEINWAFTYHPSLTYNIVEKGFMTRDEIENYYNEWKKIAYVHDKGDYMDLFRNSELLISDCGSFRIEYFPTGKPYVYLISSSPQRLKDGSFLEKICKYYYKSYNTQDLQNILDMLLVDKKDPLKTERENSVRNSSFFKNNSSQNILADMYQFLNIKI